METHLIHQLSVGDRLTIAADTERLCEALAVTPELLRRLAKSANGVRNVLAHGGTVLDELPSPSKVLSLLDGLIDLWRESSRLVARPEYLAEDYLQTRFTDMDGKGLDLSQLQLQDGVLCIITAENPGSVRKLTSENRRATELLERRLEHKGWRARPLIALSLSGQWKEHSFAVSAPIEDVCAVGREFQQFALFVVAGDRLAVVSCADGVTLGAEQRS